MSGLQELRRPGRGRASLLAIVAGLLHTASFAPVEAWWLEIGALALLAFAARDATPRRAALLGWLFGCAWLASGLWWIFISLHRFGGMPAPLAALAVALLGGGLGLYYAAGLALWARWRGAPGSRTPATTAAGFAACWLLAELARGTLLTGFPWIAGGYAHTSGPLAVWAPWIGVYGIGALAAWLAGVLGLAHWREPRLAGFAALGPLAALLVGLLLPHEFTRDTGRLPVSLLQPNIAQDLKFDSGHLEEGLRWHVQTLASARGTLVLTPESSIPLALAELHPAIVQAIRAPFAEGHRAALVGLFIGNERDGYINSFLALSASSDPPRPGFYRYGKRHLLPFGEFVPPGFRWFVDQLHIPIGDQKAGDSTTPLAVGGQRVRPLICYEDLFGEDMAGSVIGPEAATIFANGTNLAWFGPVMVQDQHLQFSRMRALELQRPMVRATNTGITGVVDHRGVLTSRLPSETAGLLETEVQGRIGVTPYARWLAALGLWPLALAAMGVLVFGWRGRRVSQSVAQGEAQ